MAPQLKQKRANGKVLGKGVLNDSLISWGERLYQSLFCFALRGAVSCKHSDNRFKDQLTVVSL